MTNKDALTAFAQAQELDQPTIRQLMRARLIEVDDITTLDTPGAERFYKPTVITTRGQRILQS